MCVNAPLFTFHPTFDIVLEDKKKTKEKVISGWDDKSSTTTTLPTLPAT
jgi:hypothetical protein